jgi:predicted metal-dependent hydrolase
MFEFLKAPLSRSPRKKQNQPKSRVEKIRLFDRDVEIYRKPYRRRLSLVVKPNGKIRVTAPSGTSLVDLTRFVQSNAEWIQKTLAGYRELRQSFPKKRYEDGEEFLYLGKILRLHIEPGVSKRPKVYVRGENLVIESAYSKPLERERAVAKFYEREGRRIIEEKVVEFAERMGLRYTKLSFRSQKTRWGSCSSKGALSFNWRLAIAPIDVIEYVVVHELAHLKHYDHSSRFWSLVETQIPEYRKTRAWLSKNQYEADFLARNSELHET